MAYQTGVSASIPALLAAVGTFLQGQGWTVTPEWNEMNAGTATGMKMTAFTSPDGSIYTFNYNSTSTLFMNLATSIDQSKPIGGQPGAFGSYSLLIRPIAGPHVGYHIFYDGYGVNVAVELVPNVFSHFNFGMITKNGSWAGGQYVTGLCTDTGYSLIGDSYAGSYSFKALDASGMTMNNGTYWGFMRTPIGASGFATMAEGGYGCPSLVNQAMAGQQGRRLIDSSPNQWNDRSVMLPVLLVQSSVVPAGGPMIQMGTVPNVAFCNIADLDPKTVVNTDWMVFPISVKNGNGSAYVSSGNYGIAYRK